MKVYKKKLCLPVGISITCDLARAGGGDERGFPVLGAGIGFMGVKAESLSNKACASRPNPRITMTSLRIVLLIEISQSADSCLSVLFKLFGGAHQDSFVSFFLCVFFLPVFSYMLHTVMHSGCSCCAPLLDNMA